MEIQALRMLVTEQDVNALIAREFEHNRKVDVRDVRVRLAPEGIFLSGVYETRMVDLPFETHWELSVHEGKAAARLAGFRPMGTLAGKAMGVADFFSMGSLRNLLMQGLAEAVRSEDTLQVDGDTIRCDVERLLTKHGVSVRTNLTALRCGAGQIVVEAGAPAP